MEHLYAPWRSAYFIQNSNECVFCHIADTPEKDDELGVLFRDTHCFGVMNRYPYTPGHFMVIPYVHSDTLEELDEPTWEQISDHVRSGVKMLKEVLHVKGVNIGMNLGKMCWSWYRRACALSSCSKMGKRYKFYHHHR